MFQDRLDDLPAFDEADVSQDSLTLRAGQGIDLVDILNEPRPVLPVFLRTIIDFQDAGAPVVFGFFAFSPADVTGSLSGPRVPGIRTVPFGLSRRVVVL